MEEEDFSSDTSDEDYVPDGNARLTQYIINWRLVLCPEKRGRFFRKEAMSPNFGDTFFRQKAMSPIANIFNRWCHIIVQSTSTNQLNGSV